MNVDEQTAMDMLEAIGNLTEDENPLHLGSMMN